MGRGFGRNDGYLHEMRESHPLPVTLRERLGEGSGLIDEAKKDPGFFAAL